MARRLKRRFCLLIEATPSSLNPGGLGLFLCCAPFVFQYDQALETRSILSLEPLPTSAWGHKYSKVPACVDPRSRHKHGRATRRKFHETHTSHTFHLAGLYLSALRTRESFRRFQPAIADGCSHPAAAESHSDKPPRCAKRTQSPSRR